jgi:UDP-N-acetylglucosamine--N-acetylmuramyl-(pentapeptide) pyrophosphoryl-undecaprenol N-acetylglucosamine transferase
MLASQQSILMMAGGTGGHIFPALAIAEELSKQNYKIVWLGTKNGMESRLVPENGYDIEYIDIAGLRGKGISSLLTMPFKLIKAVIQTFSIIKKVKPVMSIGMGGFVTGPGGLVSRIMGKPLVIHEQNAISGMSNNLLSFIATQKLCAFPNAYKGKWKHGECLVTGNPVRKDLIKINNIEKKQNKQAINILVLGGSLGAQIINETVPATIKQIQQQAEAQENKKTYQHYSIKHQCGRGKESQVNELIKEDYFDNKLNIKVDYQVMEFIKDMAQAYQWADLVICRSGALTVSEIACVGKASILIPYLYAVDDHQTENAKYLTEQNAGYLLSQNNLTIESLKEIIGQCTPEKIEDMSNSAKKLAKANATKVVVENCLSWITNTDKQEVTANG